MKNVLGLSINTVFILFTLFVISACKPSCTDKGWSTIKIYSSDANNISSRQLLGISRGQWPTTNVNFKNDIDNINFDKDKIKEVEIDSCTEKARQILLTGLDDLIVSSRDSTNTELKVKVIEAFHDTNVELQNQGLDINNLKIFGRP